MDRRIRHTSNCTGNGVFMVNSNGNLSTPLKINTNVPYTFNKRNCYLKRYNKFKSFKFGSPPKCRKKLNYESEEDQIISDSISKKSNTVKMESKSTQTDTKDVVIEDTRDLDKYASEMQAYVNKLKTEVGSFTNDQISLMIHENKICKSMFQQVFNVLVIEQVNRLNKKKEFEECEKEAEEIDMERLRMEEEDERVANEIQKGLMDS